MFEITLEKAKNGDAKAQNNVAAYYREKGDCESAYYWYQQAIRQGDPVAEYGMGQCCATGCGTEQNYKIAAFHFKRAAEKGVREAALVLAEMYERGIGVEQNYYIAAHWREKANSR
jgi:TPR repeat protein